MKSLNWYDGLPKWQRDELHPEYGNLHLKHAIVGTTTDEIITLVISWTEKPATWLEPRQIENDRWNIYVNHEMINTGEGAERDAIAALDRILENLHITLEE